MPSKTSLSIIQEWYRTTESALLAADIEWDVLPSFPFGGVYRGRSEVVNRFFPAIVSNFAAYETCPQDFIVNDNTVISIGVYKVTGKLGTKIEASFAHIWTVKDDVIIAFRQIADTSLMNSVQ